MVKSRRDPKTFTNQSCGRNGLSTAVLVSPRMSIPSSGTSTLGFFEDVHKEISTKEPKKNALWVVTKSRFMFMIADIKENKHIAIDTEHHTEHSYNGMICLIQISTQKYDYLVDSLDPLIRDLIFKLLKPVLEDKSILKIFHDPTNDVKLFQPYQQTRFQSRADGAQFAIELDTPRIIAGRTQTEKLFSIATFKPTRKNELTRTAGPI